MRLAHHGNLSLLEEQEVDQEDLSHDEDGDTDEGPATTYTWEYARDVIHFDKNAFHRQIGEASLGNWKEKPVPLLLWLDVHRRLPCMLNNMFVYVAFRLLNAVSCDFSRNIKDFAQAILVSEIWIPTIA